MANQDGQIKIIDMHCHVLPGVDDGAQSMEESLELVKKACAQGVRSIIATPHYSRRSLNPDRHAEQESLRAELEERIQDEIDADFEVFLGQEVYYHEEITQRIRDGYGWPMADSRYMLIEFDTRSDYETIFRGLRKLANAGYRPILAHMERFPAIRRKGGIEELMSLGVVMQMNYESLAGSFLNGEVRWCREQVKSGVIDVLGSDMHRLDFRPPNLMPALHWLQKALDPEDIRRLCYENPMRIVWDRELL